MSLGTYLPHFTMLCHNFATLNYTQSILCHVMNHLGIMNHQSRSHRFYSEIQSTMAHSSLAEHFIQC